MKNLEQPAFPITQDIINNCDIKPNPFGLTKREYFTAMAIQGICGAIKVGLFDAVHDREKYGETISKLAIEIADRTLKELK